MRYKIPKNEWEQYSGKIWQKGMERLVWLITNDGYQNVQYSELKENEWPTNFPYQNLAEKILGSVVIFSQLGLHIAHTIASLYNIYRRHTFKEVILAGGVMSGATGEIVKGQAEAFLLKYYDKIYGPGKYLPPQALQLASSENMGCIGPFGAAMLANRAYREML